MEQRINIEPNITYELSGFGKVAEDGHRVFFGVKDYEDDPEVYTGLVITDSSFVDASLIFTTGSDNLTALVYYYVEDSGNQAFGNDFKLVKVE